MTIAASSAHTDTDKQADGRISQESTTVHPDIHPSCITNSQIWKNRIYFRSFHYRIISQNFAINLGLANVALLIRRRSALSQMSWRSVKFCLQTKHMGTSKEGIGSRWQISQIFVWGEFSFVIGGWNLEIKIERGANMPKFTRFQIIVRRRRRGIFNQGFCFAFVK